MLTLKQRAFVLQLKPFPTPVYLFLKGIEQLLVMQHVLRFAHQLQPFLR